MDTESQDMEAQLAALADGTLPSSERERLLSLLQARPELADELARQRQAIATLGPLHDVSAPAALRRSIESMAANAPRRAPAHLRLPEWRAMGGRRGLRLAAVGMLIAAVAAVAIGLSTQPASGPTVAQAATLALRPATLPAPPQSRSRRDVLTRAVDGISYPYWQDSFGWRAYGARTDSLSGRAVTTVFYTPALTRGRLRIGYAIVTGKALPIPAGAVTSVRGVRFSVLAAHGATIVTWRRAGHTCILVARGVDAVTLVRLASWE